MYAIVKIAGKQYRVTEGDVIDVDLLDADPGASLQFSDVLFVHDGTTPVIGEPKVPGYVVTGEIVDLVGGPKVTCVKYIPGNHRRKIGHRQHYSRVRITGITG